MDTDETQIKAAKDYSLQPITEQLIGAAFEVHNVLGFGFLEKVYQRAMQVELQTRGVKVELEPKILVANASNINAWSFKFFNFICVSSVSICG